MPTTVPRRAVDQTPVGLNPLPERNPHLMMDTPLAPIAVGTGASSGIGRSLATEFADRGFDLVLAAEDAGIHSAAAELSGARRWVRAVQVGGPRTASRPCSGRSMNCRSQSTCSSIHD